MENRISASLFKIAYSETHSSLTFSTKGKERFSWTLGRTFNLRFIGPFRRKARFGSVLVYEQKINYPLASVECK
jgi:hypothetical protein